MPKSRWACSLVVALSLLLGQRLLPTHAQDPAPPAAATPATGPVRDSLSRPYPWAFGEPTTLKALVGHLNAQLGGRVVLDASALGRLDLPEDEPVQLDLPEGVRLQTGLKLLLDQVGLKIRVMTEDNVLLITDAEGADESVDRVLAEVKELHRDLHDLQDRVEEITSALGLNGEGMLLRKPTIIEEQPEPDEPQGEKRPKPRSGV